MVAKTFALVGLAALASAHIKISQPIPYGKSTLDNSPIDQTKKDFPCKQRPGVYDLEGAKNVYAQGSKQQLEFIGSAVHGGGSCQVSVTTDMKPTTNSVWKVIKSIEGGCPAKGTTGNLEGGASAEVPFKYDYTIPKELAAGNYTLAWTWFNKVGNREMYMNCAPLTVTGSGGSQSFMNGLPDMFVANAGVNDCSTAQNSDLTFPDPGKDVDKFNGATTAFSAPVGTCTGAAGSGNGGSAGGSSGGNNNGGNSGGNNGGSGGSSPTSAAGNGAGPAPTSVTAVSQPAASQAAASKSQSVPGGVFITVSKPSDNSPTETSAPAADPSDSQPENSSDGGAGNPAPTSGSGSGGGDSPAGGFTAGSACSDEGAWNCAGGTSFQRCASGTWSVLQSMAAGTKCNPGQANTLNAQAAKVKRAVRYGLRLGA